LRPTHQSVYADAVELEVFNRASRSLTLVSLCGCAVLGFFYAKK
jgi:hypothetical protein